MWLAVSVLVGLYLVCSSIAYGVYAWDKRAAQQQVRRVPEKWLHSLALAGGWPGAFLAQRRLRHKNRKISFQIVFWLTVIANCILLAGLVNLLLSR